MADYKGYCTPAQVATYLGVVFKTAQAALCEFAIGAAEQWVDNEIEHAWLEANPVTETIYNPQGVYIFLKKAPIVSVSAISVSAPMCEPLPLLPESNYFVQSLRDGRIYSPYTRGAYQITVVYVPNSDAVPADIHMATLVLAATNMKLMPTMLDGVDPSLVEEYDVGGELRVKFRKTLLAGVPPQVLYYLDGWRKNYVVI